MEVEGGTKGCTMTEEIKTLPLEDELRELAESLARAEETSGLNLGTEDERELVDVLEAIWMRSPRGGKGAFIRLARYVRLRELIATIEATKKAMAVTFKSA